MKALIDTNIFIDYYSDRENADEAEKVLRLATRRFTGMMMASQIKDLFYILRKDDKNKVKEFLKDLHDLLQIIDLTRNDSYNALHSEMNDLEDAILSYSANRNKANYIITWNVKDFALSPVKAVTPREFVNLMEKSKGD